MSDRCASRSRARGEELHGTASRARRWLLFEQPGAWGRDALSDSDLPAQVAAHLRSLADDLPARVLLLRRTGGTAAPSMSRTLLVGRSDHDGGWLERFVLDSPDDMLDLDLTNLSTGESVGGERLSDPVYLVCTNGRHDACCAEYGLPVARAVTELVGDRAWECSHVGGDRFAGNVVCLPDGIFYGHLDPATARAAVAAHESGRVLLERYRGRSSLPFAAQAAEALARRALDLRAVDALRFVGGHRDDTLMRAQFVLQDRSSIVVTVRQDRGEERSLTCDGPPDAPAVYDLLLVETNGRAG